jgi:histidinol-phosphate aminotransferase
MSRTFNNYKRAKINSESRINYLRLDKNERVSKFPKNFIKIFKKELNSENINSYPEIFKFYQLLSKNHSIKKEFFIATAGIDSGLRNCVELFGNKKVLVLRPTFAMIEIYCKIYKKKVISARYDKNLQLDKKKLINNINNKVSLIIISNPNSPTGTVIDLFTIECILKKAKKYGAKVVIDEAYYGFCKVTAESLVKKFNNLIILRTFSKAYGLAGLRVGYAISQPKNIKLFTNIKPMYEVNSLGILGANILLKYKNIRKKYLEDNNKGKKYLVNFFKKKKISFNECEGNFILFKLKKNKEKYFTKFKRNKIKIAQSFKDNCLNGYSRVTLAPKKEILRFTKLLKNY